MLDLVDEAPPYFANAEQDSSLPHVEQASSPSHVGQASSLSTAQGSSKPEPDGPGGPSYSPTADLEPAVRAALARLAEVQRRQPAQWAIHSRRAYTTLLRAAYEMPGRADEEGAAPRRAVTPQSAASCAYHCALFPDWEREQAAGGATTARAMEKALRWDEKTYSYSGMGNRVLTSYLQRPGQEGQQRADR